MLHTRREIEQLGMYSVDLNKGSDNDLNDADKNNILLSNDAVSKTLLYYVKEANNFKFLLWIVTFITLILNAVLILSGTLGLGENPFWFFVKAPIIIPIITTTLSTWLAFTKTNDRATKNRACAERLKSECINYNLGTGNYYRLDNEEKVNTFMNAFEAIKAEERTIYKNNEKKEP